MIQFLTSTSTVRLIEQIVIDAEDNLVLVSAAPCFSKELIQHLKSADDRGVSIVLMVDDVLFEEAVANNFSEFENLSIFRCCELNGHCYANERSMVVTSMGLSEELPTGFHIGTSISSEEQAYVDAMNTFSGLRESVNMLGDMFDARPARKDRPASSKRKRSPLLRVIKGGLRKTFNKDNEEESDAGTVQSCAACENKFENAAGESLCPDCERRNKYQHTSLYLASDQIA